MMIQFLLILTLWASDIYPFEQENPTIIVLNMFLCKTLPTRPSKWKFWNCLKKREDETAPPIEIEIETGFKNYPELLTLLDTEGKYKYLLIFSAERSTAVEEGNSFDVPKGFLLPGKKLKFFLRAYKNSPLEFPIKVKMLKVYSLPTKMAECIRNVANGKTHIALSSIVYGELYFTVPNSVLDHSILLTYPNRHHSQNIPYTKLIGIDSISQEEYNRIMHQKY